MRNTFRFAALGFVLALALPFVALGADQTGYLAPEAFNILPVLPHAPIKGDARYTADRAIFRSTRHLVGTPRWTMALGDVASKPADMLRDFSCAVGVTLTPDNAPMLVALIGKAGSDTRRETNLAKDANKRQRPFLIDKVDPKKICEPVKDLADSYDYPSGHATWGWTWATILAELAPDHAAAILARGRAYGESRVVCGAHNASAIEAARLSASATLTAVRATPAYQTDSAAARAELDALRHNGTAPDAKVCAAETELVAEDVLAAKPH